VVPDQVSLRYISIAHAANLPLDHADLLLDQVEVGAEAGGGVLLARHYGKLVRWWQARSGRLA